MRAAAPNPLPVASATRDEPWLEDTEPYGCRGQSLSAGWEALPPDGGDEVAERRVQRHETGVERDSAATFSPVSMIEGRAVMTVIVVGQLEAVGRINQVVLVERQRAKSGDRPASLVWNANAGLLDVDAAPPLPRGLGERLGRPDGLA